MNKHALGLTILAAALVLVSSGFAAVPHMINYQGILTDSEGALLDGTYEIEFRIYAESSGGDPLWNETHAAVAVDRGLFNVILGNLHPELFDEAMRYMEVVVEGEVISPRMQITSVAYAHLAAVSDSAKVAAGSGAGDGHSLDAADGDPVDVVYVNNDGLVGIGTSSPAAALEVDWGDGTTIQLGSNPQLLIQEDTANDKFRINLAGGEFSGRVLQLGRDDEGHDIALMGNVSIGRVHTSATLEVDRGEGSTIQLGLDPHLVFQDDAANGKFRIQLAGGGYNSRVLQIGRDNQGHEISLMGITRMEGQVVANALIVANDQIVTHGGLVSHGTVVTHDYLVAHERIYANGEITTPVIEITGGADLSEKFEVRGEQADPAPGMVVSIDSEQPGGLVLSSEPYDRKVAGIISGAGGIAPGMLMGQSGSPADGSNPVALSGRVYCWADASNGPIQPGDLLTTSDKPGHAMRVTDHARANGAILGKAMSSLESGQGLVLVLVSLQ